MKERDHLLTELRLPASLHLDTMTVEAALALMNQQDAIAVAAVAAESARIANAINLVVAAFNNNGRLFYVGAGTSGRLGVLDASECPPTFRTDPAMVQGIIAGGEAAMFRAQEGAEDNAAAGAAAIDERNINANDVVMGIAAGGTTPFVHGALRRAIELNAKTIFLSCVQPVPDEPTVDVVIRPLTGPEVLTGSTRLKAGTATKLVLNQITTLAMVQLGKCYENLMVDLKASNEKLRDRAARIVATITGLDPAAAHPLLQQANGQVKVAIIMHTHGVGIDEAQSILDSCHGHLRSAMNVRKAPIAKPQAGL
jgi:N-acetylmuramic acid 6-phosphate etherase